MQKKRFAEVYIPELIEMLNDEEIYIRIEAVEITVEIMDHLEASLIDKEFFPCFKDLIELNFTEITKRLCLILGKLAFRLSSKTLESDYKAELVEFYITCSQDKSLELKQYCAFNLPCFTTLFKLQ